MKRTIIPINTTPLSVSVAAAFRKLVLQWKLVRLLLLCILVCVIASSASSAEVPKGDTLLFLGNPNIAPVVYMENDIPAGIAIDIVHELGKHLHQPIKIIAMDWKEAQSLVARGEADALIQINKTEERKKIYDFSDQLLESQFSIFVRSDHAGISGISGLRGMRVGVESGGLPHQLLEKDVRIPLTIIPNFLKGFAMLHENVIDAVVVDYRVGAHILASNNIRNIMVTGEPIGFSYSCLAVKKNNIKLLDKINTALRTIKADGTYQKILDKWEPKEGVFHTREQITQIEYNITVAVFLALFLIAVIWMVTLRKELSKRKAAEKKLFINESRLKLATQAGNVGIWDWDVDNNVLIWDDSMFKLYGIDEKSFGGAYEAWSQTIHPEDSEFAGREIQAAIRGEREFNIEIRIIRPDGDIRTMKASSQSIRDKNGKALRMIGINIDITERRQAEDTLRKNEEQLVFTMDQSHVAYWEMDVATRTFTFNDRFYEVYGTTAEREGGYQMSMEVYVREFLLAEEQHIISEVVTRLMSGEIDKLYSEHRIRRRDGVLRNIVVRITVIRDATGRIVGSRGSNQDITESKRSEQLLAQEKERLSVTLRSIGDGVITTDCDGRIVMLNKAAEEMTGWRSEEAVQRPLPDILNIVDELTGKQCQNPAELVLRTGIVAELATHTCLISKIGRKIMIAESGAPIRDSESRVIGVVLVFRDITEKQKLNEAMQRAQKLESIGTLAGGIAHDFNNMLGGIFGYLDLAKESAVLNMKDQVPKYLDKALSVFDRAKGLTQQLLTFSKGGAPVRKIVPIAPIIHHSATFVLSGSNVTCQFDLADNLWLCDCDENQIGQVIDNIVINGKQAMPAGGKIIITAVNVQDVLGHPGAFVRISIKDEGSGIPHGILPKIFDPFFSTKATGHGLGLATVFSIIKRHDGWIDVESTLGKGSTFHIFIQASQTMTCSEPLCDTVNNRGTGTILVMDDEEFIREIVSSMLESMGYTVVLAKDGKEALTFFMDAERIGQPFLASILDLTIPGGVGGKEVASAMHKINPNSIIVVSSGYSEDPVISDPAMHGFTDRIIKPYRKKDLTELMTRIMQS